MARCAHRHQVFRAHILRRMVQVRHRQRVFVRIEGFSWLPALLPALFAPPVRFLLHFQRDPLPIGGIPFTLHRHGSSLLRRFRIHKPMYIRIFTLRAKVFINIYPVRAQDRRNQTLFRKHCSMAQQRISSYVDFRSASVTVHFCHSHFTTFSSS